MKPTGAASDQVRLHIGQSFIDAIEVHRIQPEPVETALDKEGIWLSFKKGDQAERVRVTIHYEHQQTLRKVVSSFWLEGHEAATLEQLVYP
jgi:hypothetical protein